MNKADLVAAVAEKAGISKKDSEKAVNAAFDAITEALVAGDKVQLVGFGAFETKERGARVAQMLTELTATSGDLQQTLMQDARSQLEELLRECISAVGKEPEAMKKTDRMRIIRMLYKRRAFTYQKSVAIVAERLNVSRYTVYKYMHELEEAEKKGEHLE